MLLLYDNILYFKIFVLYVKNNIILSYIVLNYMLLYCII